jgi:sterol desaturase/sphingolipid hydroxylase (fatty acid hydroxylase superfamily)
MHCRHDFVMPSSPLEPPSHHLWFPSSHLLNCNLMSLSEVWVDILHHHSPARAEFIGTLLVQLLCFYAPALIYTLLPYFLPAFSEKNKLQKAEKQPTNAEIIDCLHIVLRNQVLSSALHLVLLTVDSYTGKPPSYRFDWPLPGIEEILRDVMICIFLREVLFYYSHRILHLPSIYSRIHKVHHRFTAPVALSAQYSTITEHFLSNILPVILPPMILRVHIITFWVFLAEVLLETTTVHSGYGFFGGMARKHDMHHEKFNIYFGAVGFLDWLHGTDGSRKTG